MGSSRASSLALQSGGALCAERPFYPADVCSALGALPRPRTLVSTPIHLRALLASQAELPPADLIVSATAPLPPELAREAEQRFRAPLLEIYGSTESGQLATRRTARAERMAAVAGRVPHSRGRARLGTRRAPRAADADVR